MNIIIIMPIKIINIVTIMPNKYAVYMVEFIIIYWTMSFYLLQVWFNLVRFEKCNLQYTGSMLIV